MPPLSGGYQLFIVLAATGYLLGATQSKEYAEPEWYVDIWLTIVWLAYLAVFMGTIYKLCEKHIYVAMLHVINNLSVPVRILGSKSGQDVFRERNQRALLVGHPWYRL